MSATTVVHRTTRTGLGIPGPSPLPEWLGLTGTERRRLPALGLGVSTMAAAVLAWVAAFWLRFDGSLPAATGAFLLESLPLVVLVKGAILWMSGVFRIVWAYVGIADARALLRASLLAGGAGYGILAAFSPERLAPRSIAVLDAVFTFLGTAGVL